MGSELLLGLDVGTTHTKGLLLDAASGAVAAQTAVATPSVEPRPGWREYDPAALWAGVRNCIRALTGGLGPGQRVTAVAAASMGEAGTLYDREGAPLAPIIAWHDPRTIPQRDWWAAHADPRRIHAITGQHLGHIFSANKLMWLRENRPEAYGRAAMWLGIQDMVTYRLCGARATDYTIASRTMLLDQAAGDWSEEMLGLAGIPRALLPESHPSGTAVGRVTPEAARETGLAAGMPVATGGHDHLCAALACGCTRPGAVLDSTGTAEALLWIVGAYRPTEELYRLGYATYRHTAPGTCVILGGLDTGGAYLEWMARLLGLEPAGERVAQLLALAERSEPGARGVRATPFLLGKGTPRRDPAARAAIMRLSAQHGREDLARAAVEALAWWLCDNLAALGELLGERPAALIGTGGVNRSPFVCQLKADATGLPFRAPRVAEGAALGAAMLAGIGAGIFRDAEAARAAARVGEEMYRPDAGRGEAYRESLIANR